VLAVTGWIWLGCRAQEAEIPPDRAKNGRPRLTAAFVDLDGSPLGALVERRLLDDSRAVWLERARIDEVLAEQELAALFGGGAPRDRVALGHILKADLLLLLRKGERESAPFGELVVAETRGGLRLLARKVPLSDDVETDAERVAELAHAAMARFGGETLRVFAVPPFISNDLTHELDHLRGAYASLFAQALQARPGVYVVELEEAEAIAREYQLADPGERPTRELPMYVLGEYRHEGRGEDRQVTVTLRLKRGDELLGEARQTQPPAKAAGWLQQAAGNVARWGGAPAAQIDPEAELRQLARRAGDFTRLGDWAEALELLEAGCLLQPNSAEFHRQAARAASLMVLPHRRPKTIDSVAESLRCRRAAIRHLEAFLECEPDAEKQVSAVFAARGAIQNHVVNYAGFACVPPELRAACRDGYAGKRVALMRMAHRWAQAGLFNEAARAVGYAVEHLPPDERYTANLRFLLQYQDRLSARKLIGTFGPTRFYRGRKSVEAQGFLRRLAACREAKPEVRARVAAELAEIEAAPCVWIDNDDEPGEPAPSAPSRLSFRPLELTWHGSHPLVRETNIFKSFLAVDGGIDVVFRYGNAVYVMKEKGHAKLVWASDSSAVNDLSNVYDGRYVWMTMFIHRRLAAGGDGFFPEVWVLDPVEEKAWQIGTDHGLPFGTPQKPLNPVPSRPEVVLAAPVAPGRAILAGSFGRNWLADVTFDPDGNHQVHVFREMRDVAERTDKEAWRNTNLVFHPLYMATLTGRRNGSGSTGSRVLLGRAGWGVAHHPLLIDPVSRTLEALETGYSNLLNGRYDLLDGALYYTDVGNLYNKNGVLRVRWPDMERQPVVPCPETGQVIFQGDVVNVVGEHWWRGRLTDEKLENMGNVSLARYAASGLSEPFHSSNIDHHDVALVSRSNHFGLVAGWSCGKGLRTKVMTQVVFDDPQTPIVVTSEDGASGRVSTEVPGDVLRGLHPPRLAEHDVPKPFWGSRAELPIACQSLAFGPAGSAVVTVGESRRYSPAVRLWDATTGELRTNLLDYPASITAVAFSPDGTRLATGAEDGLVLIWSTEDWKPLRACKGHIKQVDDVGFSPDNRWLASTSDAGTVRVWNVDTGEEMLRTGARVFGGRVLAFPGGKRFLTVGWGPNDVLLWDVPARQGYEVQSLREVAGLLPDGTVLGSSNSEPRRLVAWDPRTGVCRTLWEEIFAAPIAVSADGRLVATYESNGFVDGRYQETHRVRVWNVATRKELGPSGKGWWPKSAQFTPDGKSLLFVSHSACLERLALDVSE